MNRGSLAAILALAASLALGAGPSAFAADEGPVAQQSVVAGGVANPTSWPFAAAIFRKGRLHCGGSVVSPTEVLTAGHCVFGFAVANFTVVTGRPDLRNQGVGEVIAVQSARVHPDYESSGAHDSAVLRLARPTTAPPVTLASSSEDAAATAQGALLRVAGWGATTPFGTRLSSVLRVAVEKVRSARRCLRAYTIDLFSPQTMICAVGKRIRRFRRPPIHFSACGGDSGGPLVADTPAGPRQVGIVSFGAGLCGLPGAPTVYSRVSDSLQFIRSSGP
jgi:secreted trypsin-like serine protease